MTHWEYKPGEMEAWSEWLKNPAVVLPTYTCSQGHMLESPVPLNQAEIDVRCMGCQNINQEDIDKALLDYIHTLGFDVVNDKVVKKCKP